MRIPLAAVVGVIAAAASVTLTFAQPRGDLFPFYYGGMCFGKVAECTLVRYEKPWDFSFYFAWYRCNSAPSPLWGVWKAMGRVERVIGYYCYMPGAELPDAFGPVPMYDPPHSFENATVVIATTKVYRRIDVLEGGICR